MRITATIMAVVVVMAGWVRSAFSFAVLFSIAMSVHGVSVWVNGGGLVEHDERTSTPLYRTHYATPLLLTPPMAMSKGNRNQKE